jgi:hypothetical protein
VSDPPLQALVREVQTILQGDRLVNGIAVMEKKQVVGAVNVSYFGKKEGPGVRDGASGGVMKVAIPKSPLALGDRLEMMAQKIKEVACLIPVPWKTQSA